MGAQPFVIIVAGPTASGKSDFSEEIARAHNGEIINADSVQMFTRLSVGTAKPDWKTSDIPHHLFDICDKPKDFDVASYRQSVKQLVSDIHGRGKTPILVGGSLFYIKSLFYPPVISEPKKEVRDDAFSHLSDEVAWDKLNDVDPIRADNIHPNDRYRVNRALALWESHGIPPSQLQPTFQPLFRAKIIFLSPEREILYDRINRRTHIMIEKQGWLDEARDAYKDREWRDFILQKKFIGYPELFAWIESGESSVELSNVIQKIKQETRRYARRQATFWRSFYAQLGKEPDLILFCQLHELASGSNEFIKSLRSS